MGKREKLNPKSSRPALHPETQPTTPSHVQSPRVGQILRSGLCPGSCDSKSAFTDRWLLQPRAAGGQLPRARCQLMFSKPPAREESHPASTQSWSADQLTNNTTRRLSFHLM